MSPSSALRAKVEKQYQEVPLYIREDVIEATLSPTGRFLVQPSPNMQNIPIHTEEARRIRKAIAGAVIEYLNGC